MILIYTGSCRTKNEFAGEKLMVYSLSAAEILIEEQESERDAVK